MIDESIAGGIRYIEMQREPAVLFSKTGVRVIAWKVVWKHISV